MKNRKRPVIILPHGAKSRLAKELNVSTETVRKALKFATDSEESRKIQREAIENYKGELVEISIRI